jgi:hypothetical protein
MRSCARRLAAQLHRLAVVRVSANDYSDGLTLVWSGFPALLKAHPCRSLLVLCTAIALIVASAVYSQHALGQPQHDHGHCDLCLHLGGTAGTAPTLSVPGKAAPVTAVVRLAPELDLPARRIARPQQPRGPPAPFRLA